MIRITDVDAWEVLDSRGSPTVRVRVDTDRGRGVFTVPAGASTGTFEARERRDGGTRFGGQGVRKAVGVVCENLRPLLVDRDVTHQRELDELLIEAEGTANLSRWGANAVLGASGAVARAASDSVGQPLYRYLSNNTPRTIPLPMVNILSGGLHAEGGIRIQDFLIHPVGADSYSEALEMIWAIRSAARERVLDRGWRPLLADEGGFSPPFHRAEEALEFLQRCVEDTKYRGGRDGVAIGLDVAATHFHDAEDGLYRPAGFEHPLTTDQMIDWIAGWVEDFPIISLEDPLAETEWEGWQSLVDRLQGSRVQVIADDLVATDPRRLDRALETGAANAVLVKPNQAGTLSRAMDVMTRAREAGMARVVSARSGETCDTTIADLAVARGAPQIKIGSLACSERTEKYNRLRTIERQLPEPGLASFPFP